MPKTARRRAWPALLFLPLFLLVAILSVPAGAQGDDYYDYARPESNATGDAVADGLRHQVERVMENGGQGSAPLMFSPEYAEAYRGLKDFDPGAPLPSADAKAQRLLCDSCRLLLEMMVFTKENVVQLEELALRASQISGDDSPEANDLKKSLAAARADLARMSIQAADCFAACVPPEKMSPFIPDGYYEVPRRAYPGEPLTCAACSTHLQRLRPVNAELYKAQQRLDVLEAQLRRYGTSFDDLKIDPESDSPERLSRIISLLQARYYKDFKDLRRQRDNEERERLSEEYGGSFSRDLNGNPIDPVVGHYHYPPPTWAEVEGRMPPTIAGRAKVMAGWTANWFLRLGYNYAYKPGSAAASAATTGMLSFLLGGDYVSEEEVARQRTEAREKIYLDYIAAAKLALQLRRQLGPQRQLVADLRAKRKAILAALLECHIRACVPVKGTGLPPIEPLEEPDVNLDPPKHEEPAESEPVQGADGAGLPEEPAAEPDEDPVDDSEDPEMAAGDGTILETPEFEDPVLPPVVEIPLEPLEPLEPAPLFPGTGVTDGGTTPPEDGAGEPESTEGGAESETAGADGAGLEGLGEIEEMIEAANEPEPQLAEITVPPLARSEPHPGCENASLGEPHPACERLPEADRAECRELAARYECLAEHWQETEGCLARCEAKSAGQDFNAWLLETNRRVTGDNYAAALLARRQSEEEAEALMAERQTLAEEIADAERGRQVYYYENTNNGEIVSHFGEYFDPVPPLVYRGDGRLPLNARERAKLEEKQARLAEIESEIAEVLQEQANIDQELTAWHDAAMNDHWQPPPQAGLHCTAEMFQEEYTYCIRNCTEENFRIGDSSCLASFSSREPFYDIAVRRLLYPPGHPMRLQE